MRILKKHLGYVLVMVFLCALERAQASHGGDHSNRASTSADASYEEDLPSEKELKRVQEYIRTRHAKGEPVVMVLGAQEHHAHFKEPDMVYLDLNDTGPTNEKIDPSTRKYPSLKMNFNDPAHLEKLTRALGGKFDLIFTDIGVAQHMGEAYEGKKRISTYQIVSYLMRLLNEGGRLRITMTGNGNFELPTGPQFAFYCRDIEDLFDRESNESLDYFGAVSRLTLEHPDAFPPYRSFGLQGYFFLPIVRTPGPFLGELRKISDELFRELKKSFHVYGRSTPESQRNRELLRKKALVHIYFLDQEDFLKWAHETPGFEKSTVTYYPEDEPIAPMIGVNPVKAPFMEFTRHSGHAEY